MAKYISAYTGAEIDAAIALVKDVNHFQLKLTPGTGISISDQTIAAVIKAIKFGSAAAIDLRGEGTVNFAVVASTGSYNDLLDQPTAATFFTITDVTVPPNA